MGLWRPLGRLPAGLLKPERTWAYRYLAGQIRNETGAFWNGCGSEAFRNGGGLLVGGGGVGVEGV
jgi:hypothetical protein